MAAKRKSSERRRIPPPHADHFPQLARLKRIKGQIEGIERMIEDRRRGPDILVQIAAARAALRSLEVAILRDHVGHFSRRGAGGSGASDAKLDELLMLFQRLAN